MVVGEEVKKNTSRKMLVEEVRLLQLLLYVLAKLQENCCCAFILMPRSFVAEKRIIIKRK